MIILFLPYSRLILSSLGFRPRACGLTILSLFCLLNYYLILPYSRLILSCLGFRSRACGLFLLFVCLLPSLCMLCYAVLAGTGDVFYSVAKFNQKNRENLTADMKELMAESTNALVVDVSTVPSTRGTTAQLHACPVVTLAFEYRRRTPPVLFPSP